MNLLYSSCCKHALVVLISALTGKGIEAVDAEPEDELALQLKCVVSNLVGTHT
jgi:hypothetical protein